MQLFIGQLVENFGAICVVTEIDAQRGVLLKIVKCTLNGVAQGGHGQQFYANPAFCKEAPAGVELTYF
jgi:hypothetical protein